jgi:uncharacterized protein (DUF1501 family)
MDRRKFVRNMSLAGTGGIMLGGVPMQLLAGNANLKALLAETPGDKVMVFIQLHGGNDGLNTIVPINQYNEYYTWRPNIALPQQGSRKIINLDTQLTGDNQVGIHPDMLAFKQMYDDGSASVVLNVGYDNMNLSHFRGRDILFMGGGSSDYYNSGWMGRFLDIEYPGYPDAYPNSQMPDPIGIELGETTSIAFHRDNGIPIGFSIDDPDSFYKLITGVGINPPLLFPDSYAGDEYRFLTQMEAKSNQYADRLKQLYDKGANTPSVVYPTSYPFNAPERFLQNPLTSQLRLIARLLNGGIKTRVFLCRIGGFDTHSGQVESYDTTMGAHSALLYHLTTAVKAFYDDLKAMSLDSKVLSLTFTEFGRRVYSNASYGTDHGTATPILLFGSSLKGGVVGTNPDLSNLDNGNLKYTVDYRRLYTSLLSDWMGASNDTLQKVGFGDFIPQKLDLLTGISNLKTEVPGIQIYPNPASDKLYVKIKLKDNSSVVISILDAAGKIILTQNKVSINEHSMNTIDIARLNSGFYFITISNKHGEKYASKFEVRK